MFHFFCYEGIIIETPQASLLVPWELNL